MMEKITFKCNNCGWEKQIPGQWTDLSPRFCGNNSCELSAKKGKGKKSFKSHPEQLEKKLPPKKIKADSSETTLSKQPKVRKKK